jgi:hypothetical protein
MSTIPYEKLMWWEKILKRLGGKKNKLECRHKVRSGRGGPCRVTDVALVRQCGVDKTVHSNGQHGGTV